MAKKHKYCGEDITVYYNKEKCIHAAVCVRSLPNVFVPSDAPWVKPDKATSAEIIDTVTRCPTGALEYEVASESEMEKADETNTVLVEQDGPLMIRGDVIIKNPDGETVDAVKRVALCRCGLSRNKPYCDGSHTAVFSDDGELGDQGLKASVDDEPTGPLTITCAENGPLLCSGPVTVISADRETMRTGNKSALCRCGASSNKPFCDGSHKQIDFVS